MLSTKSSLFHQWSDGCFSCLLQTSLFKFVSGCADLLPPLLFVPYMKMLCSLASHPQAARHAFNLLKQNVVGNSVNVSWDHFFQSLNRYLVCGVFMSVLWWYFSWGHSESDVSYECGSDSHWLWSKVLIDIEYVDIVCMLICIALAEDIISPHHLQLLHNRTYIQKHCVF